MTTGFKINGAKDNAAGYSIAEKMVSKISSYDVALDNTQMGLDLIETATSSLDLITNHLQRIRDLAEQAANGTYGADSLKAIQSEVDARTAEIERVIENTEYNGIQLFKIEPPQGSATGTFIQEVTPLTEAEALAQGYTLIKTAEDLAKIGTNGKYILMNDIDLSNYHWSGISNFSGELDGNGHVIKNLNNATTGLFGDVTNGVIKNLGIVDSNFSITNYSCGVLVSGVLTNGTVENCYSESDITGSGTYVGGLIGFARDSVIDSCYVTGDVYGDNTVGGIIGSLEVNTGDCIFRGGFFSGTVTGNDTVGGISGYMSGDIMHSFSTGNIIFTGSGAYTYAGGIVGRSSTGSVSDSYFSGNITGNAEHTGGIMGEKFSGGAITNSYILSQIANLDGSILGNADGTNINVYNNYYNSYYNRVAPVVGSGSYSGNGGRAYAGDAPFVLTPIVPVSTDTNTITLQVGIDSSDNSRISFETGVTINLNINVSTSNNARNSLEEIDSVLDTISVKQTEFGAVQNRLESATETITVQQENLVSSLSTIRDADIAEESSQYIKMQILQQASATLLATANQTPAIALQLL